MISEITGEGISSSSPLLLCWMDGQQSLARQGKGAADIASPI